MGCLVRNEAACLINSLVRLVSMMTFTVVLPLSQMDIGVREGILLGGRKKFALKIIICPNIKQFALKLTFLV